VLGSHRQRTQHHACQQLSYSYLELEPQGPPIPEESRGKGGSDSPQRRRAWVTCSNASTYHLITTGLFFLAHVKRWSSEPPVGFHLTSASTHPMVPSLVLLRRDAFQGAFQDTSKPAALLLDMMMRKR
jgi:hypothetical protein